MNSDGSVRKDAGTWREGVLVFRGGASKRFAAAAQEPFVAAFASPPEMVVCPRSGHFPTTTEPDIVARALPEFPAP